MMPACIMPPCMPPGACAYARAPTIAATPTVAPIQPGVVIRCNVRRVAAVLLRLVRRWGRLDPIHREGSVPRVKDVCCECKDLWPRAGYNLHHEHARARRSGRASHGRRAGPDDRQV